MKPPRTLPRFYRVLSLMLVAPACSDAESTATPMAGERTPPARTTGGAARDPLDDASHILDPDVIHTFDVEVDPSDLALVDSEPSKEQYVPARLRFEGKTYEVGYRYKGSVGAFRPPCTAMFDGGPKAEPGKCSVKLSMNWKDPDAQFFGLRKLVFHAMNKDPSLLRERLGYALFREMGVPAPRATHAVLRVNGKADLYALVEEIDGRFTRSHFSDGGKGNLYKEIWPIHDDPNAYAAALETNEDDEPSTDRMVRFAKAVLEGPDAMASWIDMETTASYMAVDRVIVNDDGAFNFYCHDGGRGNNPSLPGNHNYYWYEESLADRMWIIPWDLDHAMRDSGALPHIPLDWRTPFAASQCGGCTRGGLSGPPPGCDPVIRNFQAWQHAYDEKIDAFIAGPFSKSSVTQNLDHWRAQIVAAGYSIEQTAIDDLTRMLDGARANRGYRY